MEEFSAYEKMPNSLKKLGLLSDTDFAEMDKLKWVVTEKVHGANFSFVYENNQLKFAKRKEYLQWKDDFFGFQLVVNKLESKILALFEALSLKYQANKLIVYGELFGGKYPHPNVAPEAHLQPVQTGVYYTPTIEFCAFDIAIEVSNKFYLDYESAIAYFEKFGIFYAKPLLIGKFNEAMNFNTRIDSKVPVQLALPALESNLIEGVVVKPYNQKSTQLRPIIKLKNKEFDEEKKFHQAEKWSYIPNVSSKSEDLSYIIEEIKNYVNQNRLESVISKIGQLDKANEERMLTIKAEFLEDVITDFNENNEDLLEELETDEKEWIVERIKSEIKLLIASL